MLFRRNRINAVIASDRPSTLPTCRPPYLLYKPFELADFLAAVAGA